MFSLIFSSWNIYGLAQTSSNWPQCWPEYLYILWTTYLYNCTIHGRHSASLCTFIWTGIFLMPKLLISYAVACHCLSLSPWWFIYLLWLFWADFMKMVIAHSWMYNGYCSIHVQCRSSRMIFMAYKCVWAPHHSTLFLEYEDLSFNHSFPENVSEWCYVI